MAFRTLLYRYFFFGWLFRDVTRGNLCIKGRFGYQFVRPKLPLV